MSIDKGSVAGNTSALILKLLEGEDMYGYRMIEVLAQRSGDIFNLKAGTLYSTLHNLERNGFVDFL